MTSIIENGLYYFKTEESAWAFMNLYLDQDKIWKTAFVNQLDSFTDVDSKGKPVTVVQTNSGKFQVAFPLRESEK
jgi:hypothetical protein